MRSTDWFTEARFGMFVHWGLYSQPAGVWKGRKIRHEYSEWLQASERVPRAEYRALAKTFNPKAFDAEAWIREAHRAGMRYFLITAKHHDGFALWPSKVSAFNVMDATPFKRDILGELATACRKFDVRLGFYYSHWQDWAGSGGDVCEVHMLNEEYVRPSDEAFEAYWQGKCLPQVRELIESYDPSFLWFDTWSESSLDVITPARQDELISLVHGLSPACLINSRIQFLAPSPRVDFLSTMDNVFPDEGFERPWETSGTLNDSWAYHALDFEWKPTEQLIRNLVSNASLGGNYQLNVGPMSDGRFQLAAIKRLREIGAWMDVNGESIYGTRGSPVGAPAWGRLTVRDVEDGSARVYLHLWDAVSEVPLHVAGLGGIPVGAQVLETGQPVQVCRRDDGIDVDVPGEVSGCALPVIALDVKP